MHLKTVYTVHTELRFFQIVIIDILQSKDLCHFVREVRNNWIGMMIIPVHPGCLENRLRQTDIRVGSHQE